MKQFITMIGLALISTLAFAHSSSGCGTGMPTLNGFGVPEFGHYHMKEEKKVVVETTTVVAEPAPVVEAPAPTPAPEPAPAPTPQRVKE